MIAKVPVHCILLLLVICEQFHETGTRGYETFFILNSTEHGIYPARKFQSKHIAMYCSSCLTPRDLQMSQHVVMVEPWLLVIASLQIVRNHDLLVYRDDSLTNYWIIMRTEQLILKCFKLSQKLRRTFGP